MRIPIVTFAEYAAVDTAGKLIIAGTVDGISFRRQPDVGPRADGPVPIPALYLVAVLEGSIGDGLRHRLGLAVLDEDKAEVVKRVNHGEFHFQVNRYGRPMRAQIVMNIQGLVVPRPGDYEFVLLVDDEEAVSAPFYVTDETPRLASRWAAPRSCSRPCGALGILEGSRTTTRRRCSEAWASSQLARNRGVVIACGGLKLPGRRAETQSMWAWWSRGMEA